MGLIGRLRPGTTIVQAQAQVDTALRKLLIQQAGGQLSPKRLGANEK
jgi:hypothetical protein